VLIIILFLVFRFSFNVAYFEREELVLPEAAF